MKPVLVENLTFVFNQRPQIKIEKTSKNKGRQTNFFEKQDTMKSAPLEAVPEHNWRLPVAWRFGL